MSPPLSFNNEENACRYIKPTAKHSSSSRTFSRRCGFPECQKSAKRGGLCISHGGGKRCSVAGCVTSVVSRGVCVAHGGGKRCQAPTCTKSAQSGGFCWIHGGGKKCGFPGCKKRAQSGGACISHGGGKRCRVEGCNKVVQYDRLCVSHGGYRKCLSINCDKRAQVKSYCQAHSGNSGCRVVGCRKRAMCRGVCSEHIAPTPPHTAETKVAFAHCRPSIEFVETPFTVKLTELSRPPNKTTLERETSMIHSHITMAETDSPTVDNVTQPPLQYMRREFISLLHNERAMVTTPMSKRLHASDPNHRKGQNFPVLPSFQTLQQCCSSFPWLKRSETD